MLHRRTFLALSATALAPSLLATARQDRADRQQLFARLEKESGGRLGIYARDLGNERTLSYRAAERFPMCSTFKVLLASAVLRRVDRGKERLDRQIVYGPADLESYGPVTKAHVAEGTLSIAALCEAAIVVSDNTAANLLLRAIGGPPGLTAFLRANPIGDPTTRLDRNEPTLNTALPGDERDTTTPMQSANNLTRLLTSTSVLSASSSALLDTWMHNCKTGTDTLRAGVPATWVAGDKTGSGANGTRNDIAFFRPPGRAPIIVAAYLTGASSVSDDARDALLARVGRVISAALTER